MGLDEKGLENLFSTMQEQGRKIKTLEDKIASYGDNLLLVSKDVNRISGQIGDIFRPDIYVLNGIKYIFSPTEEDPYRMIRYDR